MNISSVLIIDDSEADRYLLNRLIKNSGLSDNIFEKENGAEAIEFLADYDTNRKKNPDLFPPMLIFLDVNMPIMDGFEFLEGYKKLKTDLDFSSSVLIMFSSSELEEDKTKALSYDFVKGFIYKMPTSAETLKSEVLKLIPEANKD